MRRTGATNSATKAGADGRPGCPSAESQEPLLMASEATSLHREPRPAAISTPQGPAVWIIVREAISYWIEDKASVQGAALAFYSILSLAPLVVISLAIAGLFFDEKAASSQFLGQMQSMVGKEGADAISGMLEHADKP